MTTPEFGIQLGIGVGSNAIWNFISSRFKKNNSVSYSKLPSIESNKKNNPFLYRAKQDLVFNSCPPVGNPQNPFRIDNVIELFYNPEIGLPENVRTKIQNYIKYTSSCNGGKIIGRMGPGQLQYQSKKIMEKLEKYTD